MRQPGRYPSFILLTITALLTGCDSPEEPVVSYTVRKHDSIQIPIETAATQPMDDASHRLLAAIVLDENLAWYFKSVTPIGDVPEDALEQLSALLRSLRLPDANKPVWELGDEWEELPGSGMRIANLSLGDAEFAVSKLPIRSDSNVRDYLLQNINRWRRQIALQPVSRGQLDKYSEEFETADGHPVTLVDFAGRLDTSALPPMQTSRPSQPQATEPNARSPAPSKNFTYDAPTGWREQKAGMMQLATFDVGTDQQSAKVSVSKLGGAAGGVLANVNRWRGQVGLDPLENEEQVEPQALKVDGNDSVLLEFRGEQGKSIAVAMVPNGGSVWFFKIMGDSDVVAKESANFRAFLASIRLN